MERIFDFSGRENVKETFQRSWDSFRSALGCEEFKYNEISKAKQHLFLKTFDDIFCNGCGQRLLTKSLDCLCKYYIGRGAKLDIQEDVSLERFIPKKEFIRHNNRFSPKGVEWLYLAMGDEQTALECSQKECRAGRGDRFGFCQFQINRLYQARKIVDLTCADKIQYEELESGLEGYAKKLRERALATGEIGMLEIWEGICAFTTMIYSKILSEQIFIPIKTDNKDLEYAPFQTLAQYFSSLGYVGIIYKSTVYDNAKDVVLFDKKMALPNEPIFDRIIAK